MSRTDTPSPDDNWVSMPAGAMTDRPMMKFPLMSARREDRTVMLPDGAFEGPRTYAKGH